jgi:hypothetical protein
MPENTNEYYAYMTECCLNADSETKLSVLKLWFSQIFEELNKGPVERDSKK